MQWPEVVNRKDGDPLQRPPSPDEWAAHVLAYADALRRAALGVDHLMSTEGPTLPEAKRGDCVWFESADADDFRLCLRSHSNGVSVQITNGFYGSTTRISGLTAAALAQWLITSPGAPAEGPTRPDGPEAKRDSEVQFVATAGEYEFTARHEPNGLRVQLTDQGVTGGLYGKAALLSRGQAASFARWLVPSSAPAGGSEADRIRELEERVTRLDIEAGTLRNAVLIERASREESEESAASSIKKLEAERDEAVRQRERLMDDNKEWSKQAAALRGKLDSIAYVLSRGTSK